MLSRIEFFIIETFTSFRRHPAMVFAAITCVASALFVAGLVGLGMLTVQKLIEDTKSSVRFNVFFDLKATREESLAAYERIQALPGVASAEFTNREDSWQRMTQSEPDLSDLIGDNPLPDSAVVQPTDIGDIPKMAKALEKWSEVGKVTYNAPVSEALQTFSEKVQRISTIIGVILAILSLVIIHHTIELTLYARRREIFIMSLVGATPATVATPFLLEGMVYGLAGGGVALGGLLILHRYFTEFVKTAYAGTLTADPAMLKMGMCVLLVGGVILGLFGSLTSVIKYLSRPRSKVTNA